MLFLKDPAALFADVGGRTSSFFLVCGQSKYDPFWRDASEQERRVEFERWVGNVELLSRYDPEY